jgi:hypothetical protein
MLRIFVKGPVRRLLLAALCYGMTACVTTGKYENILNSWKGSSESSLIESWGPPTEIFNSNTHKFLVYQVSQTKAFEPTRYRTSGSRDYSTELFCTTVFDLSDGRVLSWAIKGNDCRR